MICTLVQVLYKGDSPNIFGDPFYDACLREAEVNAVWGQLHYLLRSSCHVGDIPYSFVRTVNNKVRNLTAQNLFIRHHEDVILNAFEMDQIQVVPLKGTRFAERFFGSITARGTSDIDLLVRPADIPRVTRCLQSLGFSAPEPYNPRHYHFTMRKLVRRQALIVEVHWNVIKEYSSDIRASKLWNSTSPIEPYEYVRELSVPFTFYSICLHGANHEMESLKHYIDIVQLLYKHGDEISYSWLFSTAKADGTLRRVQMVLSRVYDAFPDLWRRKPLVFPENQIRQRRTPPREFLRRRFNSLSQYDSVVHRLRVFKDWVWPKPEIARWFLKAPPEAPVYRLYLKMYERRIQKAIHGVKIRVMPHKSRGEL